MNLYTKSLLTEILTPPSIPPLGGSARPVAEPPEFRTRPFQAPFFDLIVDADF